ncbi:unnamed protein product [Acanthoscelides obtectus]|uniref:Uncharacterized protein n=2 Tax=Acanthoscelides obtectus TaxID=200917 RepID=A0A9P0L0L6_ACAOB|nr:unnamed protein product [Acanthoscelides obtectus]CAK1620198.1 hypothetical protein AOBTE_LOCUS236 [Acanthoscelides obtectus]
MRTKNFMLTLCVVVSISLIFIIFGQQKPESIQNIVSTTNKQIKNFKDNLRDAEAKTLNADEKYLHLLGFTQSPRLYPTNIWRNTSLPVVVTYVSNGEESQAVGLILNVAKILPNNTILVYNLGISDHALKMLTNYCNSSRCQVINFVLSEYPSHINTEYHAHRPLVIQDALHHTGAIFFLESSYRFMHNVTHPMITRLFEEMAKKSGVLAWPFDLKNPVSSLTHKKMFEYFHSDAENFLFLQMVRADALILVNTVMIHNQVMLPWVQCSLTQDCIFPIGAQSAGCKFDKKPQYRYSGCHSYDVSALNIALGLAFKQDSSRYTCTDAVTYLETVPLTQAEALLRKLELNATTEARSPFDT